MKRLVAFALLTSLCACDQVDKIGLTEAARVRNSVREQLKDPESAKFGRLSSCTADKAMWTGSVNSKNSYGGYAGDEPFLIRNGWPVFWSSPLYDDWLKECYKGEPLLADMLKDMPSDAKRMGLSTN